MIFMVKFVCISVETIDLIDSDDDESDKATEHVSEHVSHENSNYIWQQSQEVKVVSVIDPKPSTSNTGADKNQQEPMSDVEEITEQREPISSEFLFHFVPIQLI